MTRAWATTGCLVALMACSGSDQNNGQTGGAGGTSSGSETGGGSASGGAGGLGLTVGNGGAMSSGSASGGSGGACAQQAAEATSTSRPVDIIIAIDNSGSMSEEIEEVEVQINQNFGNIISNHDPPIDFRVVLISSWGCYDASLDDGGPTFCNKGGQDICISEPLGGVPDADGDGHCDLPIPTPPVNVPGRFYHHDPSNDDNNDDGIESHDALCRFGEDYNRADSFGLQPNGYKDVLRDNAIKFFVVITDDNSENDGDSDCSWAGYNSTQNFNDGPDTVQGGNDVADHFETEIEALSTLHFGTVTNRNYVFHSIVGLEPYNAPAGGPFGDPHPPTEPITTNRCSGGSSGAGTAYQALSIRTNGFRSPSCSLDYTEIFQEMAASVIAGAAIPCEYAIPDPPPGETLDLNTVVVEYTSGAGVTTNFVQVPSLANCTPTGYYIENNTIKLCPEACTTVQADSEANLEIKYGCEVDEMGVPQ